MVLKALEAGALSQCLFLWFSRTRGFLRVHHRVADGPDVELRGVHVRGARAVGPGHREPDLRQPAVLREHQEQGTLEGSGSAAGASTPRHQRPLASNHGGRWRHPTVVPLHFHSSSPLFSLPSPAPPHPLQAVTRGRLSDRCTAVWGISY